jgi:hypothetical protein
VQGGKGGGTGIDYLRCWTAMILLIPRRRLVATCFRYRKFTLLETDFSFAFGTFFAGLDGDYEPKLEALISNR